MDSVREELQKYNKEQQSEGGRIGADITNGKSVSVHLDASLPQTRDRSTNTREQVAKLSGVGAGTVARYDAVMKSDNEEKVQLDLVAKYI